MVVDVNKVEYVRGQLKDNYVGTTIESWDGEEYALTMEVINGLDDGEMGELIEDNDELEELKQELSSVYHWSYNHAYEEEVSKELIDEINGIVGGEHKWETIKRRRYKEGNYVDYDVNVLTHKLTNFWDHLHTYSVMLLDDTWTDHDEFEYSDFSEVLRELMDNDEIEQIDIRIPDYPDHTKIQEQFKDLIHDYI
jgi:hypothetical protein